MYAVVSSQERAVRLSEKLYSLGINSEIVNTPAVYHAEGCSYSVKFDAKDVYSVRRVAFDNGIKVKFF